MKLLVQRVLQASVEVDQRIVGQIKRGLLVFLGIEKGDSREQAYFLARKLIRLRIFEDEQAKMNLSVQDIHGELLVISQFTLAADTSRGNRPGFEHAENPVEAEAMYSYFLDQLKLLEIMPQTGIFQADMKVSLINDGPATFLLEK